MFFPHQCYTEMVLNKMALFQDLLYLRQLFYQSLFNVVIETNCFHLGNAVYPLRLNFRAITYKGLLDWKLYFLGLFDCQ